jgi:hypothetical protein
VKRRAAELEHRRRVLIARSAAHRAILAAEVEQIAARLERVDGRIDAVRRFFARPWLLLGGVASLLALLGPRKLIRIGTRSAMWLGTARRVMRLVHH